MEPILRGIGPVVTHVGPNGQAVTMKIAHNLSLAVQMLAFSGACCSPRRAGSRASGGRGATSSVIASPMVKYRGPFVLEQPDEAWFDVDMMQKDMHARARRRAATRRAAADTAVDATSLLTAARGLGLAKYDFAVVFDVLAQMAGVESVRG